MFPNVKKKKYNNKKAILAKYSKTITELVTMKLHTCTTDTNLQEENICQNITDPVS
jgi:hypothetical protein